MSNIPLFQITCSGCGLHLRFTGPGEISDAATDIVQPQAGTGTQEARTVRVQEEI